MVHEQCFDIKDTWLYMGLVAQYEAAEINRYIQRKKQAEFKSASDIASLEYAAEIRSNLKETRELLAKKAKSEKSGQYSHEVLESLLKLKVVSSREFEVMKLRVHMTYEEIGKQLGIDPSTAFRTVVRVHERVKLIYGRLSSSSVEDVPSQEEIEGRARSVQNRIIESKLSDQQYKIYMLMCKGYADEEICLRLGISSGTYRVQKCRINKVKKFLDMV